MKRLFLAPTLILSLLVFAAPSYAGKLGDPALMSPTEKKLAGIFDGIYKKWEKNQYKLTFNTSSKTEFCNDTSGTCSEQSSRGSMRAEKDNLYKAHVTLNQDGRIADAIINQKDMWLRSNFGSQALYRPDCFTNVLTDPIQGFFDEKKVYIENEMLSIMAAPKYIQLLDEQLFYSIDRSMPHSLKLFTHKTSSGVVYTVLFTGRGDLFNMGYSFWGLGWKAHGFIRGMQNPSGLSKIGFSGLNIQYN